MILQIKGSTRMYCLKCDITVYLCATHCDYISDGKSLTSATK
ncbi:hypothetical protein DW063_00020 [Ruminococcus sp. AF43-11]|nr:hypothetical protein DW063_00020 [Ruminococcus sp. AF43-11]